MEAHNGKMINDELKRNLMFSMIRCRFQSNFQMCKSEISLKYYLSLIHISEPTRQEAISYAVF